MDSDLYGKKIKKALEGFAPIYRISSKEKEIATYYAKFWITLGINILLSDEGFVSKQVLRKNWVIEK